MPVSQSASLLDADFAARVVAGAPVGLAVSGGGDSVALLHLVAALGGRVHVASVDHGLRAAAAAECAFVADLCRGYGFAHCVLRWAGWDGTGNLQDRARRARQHLLHAWARDSGIADIALGHTADDQAETVLMALARGAGVDGVAGMAVLCERDGLRVHRPLLGASRADLRAYLHASGHGWVDDPSNDDPRFERVRMRQAAAQLADLGLTARSLGQVAGHMAAASHALARGTDALAQTMLTHHRGDVLVGVPLAGLAAETARRLVLAAMAQVNRIAPPPRHGEQSRLMRALMQGQGATLAGCLFTHDGPVLRISREPAAVSAAVCATTQIWDARWRLTGPHDPALHIGALGGGIALCPDWRSGGLPRASLLASPAIWQAQRLIAAPLAGYGGGWRAQIVAE